MARKELVNYISKHLAKGTSLKRIKDHLAKAGHSHIDIEEAVHEVVPEHHFVKHKGVIASIVVTLVVVVIILILVSLREPITEEEVLEEGINCEDDQYCIFENIGFDSYSCDDLNPDYVEFCNNYNPSTELCEAKELFLGESKDECILQRAIEIKDIIFCNVANNPQDCRNNYYSSVQGESEIYCDELDELCLVLSAPKGDAEYCEQLDYIGSKLVCLSMIENYDDQEYVFNYDDDGVEDQLEDVYSFISYFYLDYNECSDFSLLASWIDIDKVKGECESG